jgi:hypothetical protein
LLVSNHHHHQTASKSLIDTRRLVYKQPPLLIRNTQVLDMNLRGMSLIVEAWTEPRMAMLTTLIHRKRGRIATLPVRIKYRGHHTIHLITKLDILTKPERSTTDGKEVLKMIDLELVHLSRG